MPCHATPCHARVERLDELKALAKEYVQRPEIKARAKELRRVLRGEAGNSGWPSRGGPDSDDEDEDDDGDSNNDNREKGGGGGGGSDGIGSRDPPLPLPPPPPAGDGGNPGLIR